MYIEPNTTIRILSNVALDKTYDHSIYFETPQEQYAYFVGHTKYNLERQSFQRVNRGFMRVEIKSDNLYDWNYIMFQNTAFGNKWFYAFLKSVEYANNNVSIVEFEIDPLQTWFFDYELDSCFVEREHAATDYLFDNLVDENLDLGDEYVSNGIDDFDMNNMSVSMLTTKGANEQSYYGTTRNNVYSALRVTAGVPSTDYQAINAMIDSYVGDGQEDRIVAIYQYPSWLGDASSTEAATRYKTITPSLSTIDGYTPRNNKLFSYPYNFLLISNNNGQTAEYRWENWQRGGEGVFTIKGVFVSTPCVLIYPRNYRGILDDYDSGITLSSFPQCAWVGDTFKAWWAQNRASVVTSGISTALSSAINIAGNLAGGQGGGVSSKVGIAQNLLNIGSEVAGVLAKRSDLKNTPPQVYGQTQTDSLNPGIGRVKFSFYNLSIKAQFAKIIDDYFDRFGYATRRNKVPNRNVRPHWTYCKTRGCTIRGSIPCDDAEAICAIYNNGITWWRHGWEVGNYTLDNRPQGVNE